MPLALLIWVIYLWPGQELLQCLYLSSSWAWVVLQILDRRIHQPSFTMHQLLKWRIASFLQDFLWRSCNTWGQFSTYAVLFRHWLSNHLKCQVYYGQHERQRLISTQNALTKWFDCVAFAIVPRYLLLPSLGF